MTAIDQMARLHGWACEEKRRTLADFVRLAERLRADLLRLDPAAATAAEADGSATDTRYRKLERSIAEIEQEIERLRQELAIAEQELARIEQMREERGAEPPPAKTAGRSRRAAGARKDR